MYRRHPWPSSSCAWRARCTSQRHGLRSPRILWERYESSRRSNQRYASQPHGKQDDVWMAWWFPWCYHEVPCAIDTHYSTYSVEYELTSLRDSGSCTLAAYISLAGESADSVDEHCVRRARTHITRYCNQQTTSRQAERGIHTVNSDDNYCVLDSNWWC